VCECDVAGVFCCYRLLYIFVSFFYFLNNEKLKTLQQIHDNDKTKCNSRALKVVHLFTSRCRVLIVVVIEGKHMTMIVEVVSACHMCASKIENDE
jgi:hypothetical protein